MTDPPTVAQALSEHRRQELREVVERLNKAVDQLEYLIECEEDTQGGNRSDA